MVTVPASGVVVSVPVGVGVAGVVVGFGLSVGVDVGKHATSESQAVIHSPWYRASIRT